MNFRIYLNNKQGIRIGKLLFTFYLYPNIFLLNEMTILKIETENLLINTLLKKHNLTKAISKVKCSYFCTILTQKAKWYKIKVVVI